MSRSTLDPAGLSPFSCTGLSPSLADFPNVILLTSSVPCAVRNPFIPKYKGLASAHFARRYFGYRSFFLFLPLLRCFSSGRSPYNTMDSCYSDKGSPCRVSPFGYPWIEGYLHLPMAFRSLSRPSSAPGAKASSLRSSSLDHQKEQPRLFLLNWATGRIDLSVAPLSRGILLSFRKRRRHSS